MQVEHGFIFFQKMIICIQSNSDFVEQPNYELAIKVLICFELGLE